MSLDIAFDKSILEMVGNVELPLETSESYVNSIHHPHCGGNSIHSPHCGW